MKNHHASRRPIAFTLIELLITIAIVFVLALMLVPAAMRAKSKARSICCNCNLKQIGLGFRQWDIDHTNLFPMQVLAEFGGTKEGIALGETFRHFEVMSNELNTPVILVCPADKSRQPATSFNPSLNNSNVSYFVGLDADETQPQLFLTGDRTIFKGVRPGDGVVGLTTNNFAGWSADFHHGSINVGLADGSVQGFSSNSLFQAIKNSGVVTNWLQLP
jgi:competence protein ComGC